MKKILSVGRDRVLMPLRTMLLLRAGYGVDEACSKKEALRRLISGKFDLVLICHTIPELEQHELGAAVRRLLPGVPIVCISSNGPSTHEHCETVENIAPAFLTGLNAILGKSG